MLFHVPFYCEGCFYQEPVIWKLQCSLCPNVTQYMSFHSKNFKHWHNNIALFVIVTTTKKHFLFNWLSNNIIENSDFYHKTTNRNDILRCQQQPIMLHICLSFSTLLPLLESRWHMHCRAMPECRSPSLYSRQNHMCSSYLDKRLSMILQHNLWWSCDCK